MYTDIITHVPDTAAFLAEVETKFPDKIVKSELIPAFYDAAIVKTNVDVLVELDLIDIGMLTVNPILVANPSKTLVTNMGSALIVTDMPNKGDAQINIQTKDDLRNLMKSNKLIANLSATSIVLPAELTIVVDSTNEPILTTAGLITSSNTVGDTVVLKDADISTAIGGVFHAEVLPVAVGVSITKTPTIRNATGTLSIVRCESVELADIKTLTTVKILAEVPMGGDLLAKMTTAKRKTYDSIHDQTPVPVLDDKGKPMLDANGVSIVTTPPALIGAFA